MKIKGHQTTFLGIGFVCSRCEYNTGLSLWIQYRFIISAYHYVERTMPNRARWNWNQIVSQIHNFFEFQGLDLFYARPSSSLQAWKTVLLVLHRGYNCKSGKENTTSKYQFWGCWASQKTGPNWNMKFHQVLMPNLPSSLEESTIDCSENGTMD